MSKRSNILLAAAAAAALKPKLQTIDLPGRPDDLGEGHSVTLYQPSDPVACKKTLVNFGALGYADIDYSIIGFKS